MHKYDWKSYFQVIRELQPDAVISIVGPDVRWVGNESGYARKSEWSVIPLPENRSIWEFSQKDTWGPGSRDLGSREALLKRLGGGGRLIWYPAEVDVPIRPHWGSAPEEDDKVKSLKRLLDIYYCSVGRGAVLLLNVSPNSVTGLIPQGDIKRLQELRLVLDETFKRNLACNAAARASHIRGDNPTYNGDKAVDGNKDSYWTTDDGITAATLEFDLRSRQRFNRVMLQEYIKVGQRIEGFVLEFWNGQDWEEFARATTVGYKRLLRFNDVIAQKVRLKITQSRLCPTISEFGLYYAPPISKILAR
jgi:alpha-L-fucosidase